MASVPTDPVAEIADTATSRTKAIVSSPTELVA